MTRFFCKDIPGVPSINSIRRRIPSISHRMELIEGTTPRTDDPLSWPGPERSFPCPRSAVCIIVTNVSRPDHHRWALINFSLQRRGRCRHPQALAQCSLARTGRMSIVMLARGRLQNPLAQYDVRAGEPSRRREADGINRRDNMVDKARESTLPHPGAMLAPGLRYRPSGPRGQLIFCSAPILSRIDPGRLVVSLTILVISSADAGLN